MQSIRTERLRLVPVTMQNSDALWDVMQQPELRDYQELPDASREEFSAMVAGRSQKLSATALGRFEWLIYLGDHRAPVGWVSLRIGDARPRGAEIGYSVLSAYRKRAIATEAIEALIPLAYDVARVLTVRAYTLPANVASRRVLEKLGFTQDGVLPRGASVGGRPVDVLTYLAPERKEATHRRNDGSH